MFRLAVFPIPRADAEKDVTVRSAGNYDPSGNHRSIAIAVRLVTNLPAMF